MQDARQPGVSYISSMRPYVLAGSNCSRWWGGRLLLLVLRSLGQLSWRQQFALPGSKCLEEFVMPSPGFMKFCPGFSALHSHLIFCCHLPVCYQLGARYPSFVQRRLPYIRIIIRW